MVTVVAHADGRAGAEAIWVPTALLPRFDVSWSAAQDAHVCAEFNIGSTPVEHHLALDGEGHIRSMVFDCWSDPDRTGAWGWYLFRWAVDRLPLFRRPDRPQQGRLGWHFGTDRWAADEFFGYELTSLQTAHN